jgi:hypothetical protein
VDEPFECYDIESNFATMDAERAAGGWRLQRTLGGVCGGVSGGDF